MPNRGPTVANIRKLLAPFIPEAEIVEHARQLREAGLIPAGKPGRGGAGSAQLNSGQAALLLIALMCRGPTIGVAVEAVRTGGFKLRSRSVWLREGQSGRWFSRYLALPSPPTFLDFIEQSIEGARGALPERTPLTVVVGKGRAFDEAGAQVPPEHGGGMLIFTPDAPGRPRPAVITERGIAGSLIAEIAALFEPLDRWEISPPLIGWVDSALKTPTARERADA